MGEDHLDDCPGTVGTPHPALWWDGEEMAVVNLQPYPLLRTEQGWDLGPVSLPLAPGITPLQESMYDQVVDAVLSRSEVLVHMGDRKMPPAVWAMLEHQLKGKCDP